MRDANTRHDAAIKNPLSWWYKRDPELRFLILLISLLTTVLGFLNLLPYVLTVIATTLAVFGFLFEMLAWAADHFSENVAHRTHDSLLRLLFDENAATFVQEWSLLMYTGSDQATDRSEIVRAFKQLHLRNGPKESRHMLAFLLYLFGERNLRKLRFSCDEREYTTALSNLLACELDQVWWTCPYSPVFHYLQNDGKECTHWKKFADLGDKATRIVFLPAVLFDFLICHDMSGLIHID